VLLLSFESYSFFWAWPTFFEARCRAEE